MWVIFFTRQYLVLAHKLQSSFTLESGSIEYRDFPDGEHYYLIKTPVQGRDVVLLGGTGTDSELMELYDLACGLVDQGVHRLKVIIPYFGCSTMERAVRPGEIITAKNRARILSSIPRPGSGLEIDMLELHVDSTTCYFEAGVRTKHISATSIILDMVRSLSADGKFVLCSTDAGRAKQVEKLANMLEVPASFVFKRRLDSGSTEVTAVSAGVDGMHVIIYDDMIRTGGSLVGAAKAYRDAGASRISVVSTHGIFAADAIVRLRSCGLIDKIIVTDSHINAQRLEIADKFVEVFSITPVLAKFMSEQ